MDVIIAGQARGCSPFSDMTARHFDTEVPISLTLILIVALFAANQLRRLLSRVRLTKMGKNGS